MVQLSPSVATPKRVKVKEPMKSSALDTPDKLEMKTPKQEKNTPTKPVLQTPKLTKQALVRKEKTTPVVSVLRTPKTLKIKKETLINEAKSTEMASPTPKDVTASATKSKKAQTPKLEKPVQDFEMKLEDEGEALAPQPLLEKAVNNAGEAQMSLEQEENDLESKSNKTAGSEGKSKKVGEFGLHVKGLDFTTAGDVISTHFEQFGTVTQCSVPRNTKNKLNNKGFCFIEFDSHGAMDKALKATHTLHGKALEVTKSDAELAAGKRKLEDSNESGGDQKRQKITYENELFIARLSFSTSKDTVKEHFSRFGEVVHVGLPLKPNKELNKGFGFVAFKEASSMKKAMADTNQEIDSAKIVIEAKKASKTVSKESFSKPSHPNELFVGGLDHSTQKRTLEEYFSKYGKVCNVSMPWNLKDCRNKGYGFVSFKSTANLQNALEDDHEIDGKKVGVHVAGKKSEDKGVVSKNAEAKKVKVACAVATVEKEEDEDEEIEEEEADDEEGKEAEDEEGENDEAVGKDDEEREEEEKDDNTDEGEDDE